MNIKPVHLGSAALAASAAVALLVTGCSSNSTSTPTSSASATPAAAPASAPSGGSVGGSSAASVDGKALPASFTTTCAKQGGTLALALDDTNNSTYGKLAVTATVTSGNTVQAVAIAGSKGGSNGLGYALGFGNGMPGGSATVTKSGNTFTVTGEGVGAPDMSNPMAGPKNAKFDITFACSTIVGG